MASSRPDSSVSLDLKASLEDPSVSLAYNELLEFSDLLKTCIIDANYIIPDSLAHPIRLSQIGEKIYSEIRERRQRVKPNELKMALLLSFGCSDGVLIDTSTDINLLQRALSTEIKRGKILFPYIFGRELHDKAAKLFPRKTSLDHRETVQLLRQLPKGVFQAGHSVVGPYGCLKSTENRSLPAMHDHSVPGYLCSDETCDEIHPLLLKTGQSAVSKVITWVSEYLRDKHSRTADENARLISKACLEIDNPFQLSSYEALIETFSDGLLVDEKRRVIDVLLRRRFRKPGAQQELTRALGVLVGNPTDFVEHLDEAELLQIMLLTSNNEIIEAIDCAALNNVLVIQSSERRGRKIARWGHSLYNVRAEIGPLGVHFVAPIGSGFVARRLFELLHHLYFTSGASDSDELQYLLDGPEGLNEQELLDHAVRKYSPELALRHLVIGARRTAVEAGKFLGVLDAGELQREDLLSRLLWKIGVPDAISPFIDMQRIELYEHELFEAVKAGGSEDTLRGHISNLFAATEDALSHALTFTTWALTNDHYIDESNFTYDHQKEVSEVVSFIDTYSPTDTVEISLRKDGKNTIVPLAASFARLGKAFRSLKSSEFERPRHQLPDECRCSPKPFAFSYTIPFLNLTTDAQVGVTNCLQGIGQLAQDPVVVKVRNSTIHGNNSFPSSSEILLAIEKISAMRLKLQASGLYPQVYILNENSRDSLGNSRVSYCHNQNIVRLFYPTWTVAPGLPGSGSRLIIMPIATISSAGPLRFYISNRPGGDKYWHNWPKRWEVVSQYTALEGHRVAPGRKGDTEASNNVS